MYKISFFTFIALLSQLMLLSGISASTKIINLETVLKNLLSDEYTVSFEAEELEIIFSESEPNITRYKIGKLKPYKMRKEKYGVDGKVQEIIVQDGESQITAYPEKGLVIRKLNKNRLDSGEYFGKLISLIKENYTLLVLGESDLSGRPVSIISIKSKDAGSRPAFKIWLDHEMGIPIKSETFNLDGSLLYLSSLSNIIVDPPFHPKYFFVMVPNGTVAYEQSDQAATPVKVSSAVNDYLPEDRLPGGYVLKDKWVDEEGNLQLLYHDGLNNISVFSEDWNNKEADLKNFHKGCSLSKENVKEDRFEGLFCTRGSENIMSFILNGHRYIVVGRVSKKGLTDIAKEYNRRISKNDKK